MLSRGTIVPGVTTGPQRPCLQALLHCCVAHSGHTFHSFLSLLSLQESHSSCRPGLVLVIPQDIVSYNRTRLKKWCSLPSLNAPHPGPRDMPEPGLVPSSAPPSAPLSGQGVGCFLASLRQGTVMGNDALPSNWTVFRGVWGHQLKTLSGTALSPAICLQPQVCLSLCITLGTFWQSPLYPYLLCQQGLSDCLDGVPEAEKNVSGFNWEDVNYAGDGPTSMELYWHLYSNLRKYK